MNFQKQHFNESVELAHRLKMKVAYSNDAFELWFVLHYQLLESALTRFEYYKILEHLWNLKNYENEGKKLSFCQKIYELISNDPRASESAAIKRAKQLLDNQINKPFADQNPCTTVFQLIEALRE